MLGAVGASALQAAPRVPSEFHPSLSVSLYHNRGRAVTENAVDADSLDSFGLEPFAGEGPGCHPRGGTPVMPGGGERRGGILIVKIGTPKEYLNETSSGVDGGTGAR